MGLEVVHVDRHIRTRGVHKTCTVTQCAIAGQGLMAARQGHARGMERDLSKRKRLHVLA